MEAQRQAIWNWNGNFDLISNTTSTQMKAGDVSVAAYFIWRNNGQWSFGQPALSEFVMTFDPPGLQVMSDITFCTDPIYCSTKFDPYGPTIPPVVAHYLGISGTVGPVSIAALITFDGGILGEFTEFDVDIGFAFEPVAVTFSAVLLADMLGGIAVSMSTKF